MKRLALLLALANLGYFAWWHLYSPPSVRPAPAPALPAGVAGIRLASEVGGATNAGSGLLASSDGEEAAAPENPARAEAAKDVTSTAAPALGAPSLREEDEAARTPPAPTGGGAARCFTLGPFDSRQPAETLAVRLVAAGLHAEAREEEEEVVADYWVYLPARTPEEARLLLDRVAAEGIVDRYLDSKRHLVSLGLYRYRNMAERRRRELEALGFSPRVEPRKRRRTRYRVIVTPSPQGPSREALEQLVGEEVPVLEADC